MNILYIFVLDSANTFNVLNANPNNNGEDGTSTPIDPVRIWPSGVVQSMATIGTGMGVFYGLSKLSNISPRPYE